MCTNSSKRDDDIILTEVEAEELQRPQRPVVQDLSLSNTQRLDVDVRQRGGT